MAQQLRKHSMLFFVSCAAAVAASSSMHFLFKDSLFLLYFLLHLLLLPAIIECSTCKRVNIMHFGIKLQRSYIITKTTQHIFSCSAARNSRYQLPAEVQCPCRRSLLLFFFQLVAVLLLKCCNALLLAHTHTHIYIRATASATTRASVFFLHFLLNFWSSICAKPTFQGPFALLFC